MFDKFIRLSPVILFISYSIKLLIFNGSYSDGIILAVIAGLYYGCVYRFDEKRFKKIGDQIEELHEKLEKQTNMFTNQVKEYEKEFIDVRNYINASKAITGLSKQQSPATKQW